MVAVAVQVGVGRDGAQLWQAARMINDIHEGGGRRSPLPPLLCSGGHKRRGRWSAVAICRAVLIWHPPSLGPRSHRVEPTSSVTPVEDVWWQTALGSAPPRPHGGTSSKSARVDPPPAPWRRAGANEVGAFWLDWNRGAALEAAQSVRSTWFIWFWGFVSYLGQRNLRFFSSSDISVEYLGQRSLHFFLLTDQQRLGPSGSWAQPESRFSRTERRLDLPVQHHSCTYKHTPARSNEIRPSPELAPCMHGCLV